ncbi:MAG: LytTR family transcriptional regulator DNA-binding domain-containing protein [Bacteroidetes bacterium]|nr:LytTR family transcriptional regulator DNA-binding domain-containing protein [Bacteroidota bacterium]
MTYKAIIIDDEKPARDIIRTFLKDISDIEVIAECSDGFAGLKAIQDMKPDLVFLDIQMPKLTGFEVLELLDNPPLIIFSTAYDQYAIKAFEMNAMDYILKPYSRERFLQAAGKAVSRLQSGVSVQPELQKIIQSADEKEELLQRIAVKTRHKVHVIGVGEILYLEAEGDYVMIHTKEGNYLKEKTMKYFESHLDPEKFIRIHRSFIVNAEAIERIELYDKESYSVLLKNGASLKASTSGYKLLKQILHM